MLGDGLVRTGVARQLGDWLIVKAGRSEIRLIVLLMVAVCGLGATMSSTAVTAIFIPVVLRISKSTSRANGSRRNLGDPASGRQPARPAVRIGKARSRSR